MVSLFGTTSETIWRCRLRAIRVLRSLSLCMGLPHLRGAGPQHARAVSWARDRIRDTRGRRANTQKSGKRRMTPSRVCTSAACCAPPSSRRRPARTCRPHVRSAASNWRARTHRVPSSARVWREMQATPRLSPPTLRAGGLKRDGVGCHNRLPHPYWYVAPSLGRLPRPHPLRAIGKFAECGG